MQTFLAKICQICPFCIAKRKWPGSLYTRFMKKIERNCPFCKAYDKLHPDQKAD